MLNGRVWAAFGEPVPVVLVRYGPSFQIFGYIRRLTPLGFTT